MLRGGSKWAAAIIAIRLLTPGDQLMPVTTSVPASTARPWRAIKACATSGDAAVDR
jgi:hypothetical protein